MCRHMVLDNRVLAVLNSVSPATTNKTWGVPELASLLSLKMTVMVLGNSGRGQTVGEPARSGIATIKEKSGPGGRPSSEAEAKSNSSTHRGIMEELKIWTGNNWMGGGGSKGS